MDQPCSSSQENIPTRNDNEVVEDDSNDDMEHSAVKAEPEENIENEREPLREIPAAKNAVQLSKKVYQKKQVEDYANNTPFVDNNYPNATFKPVDRKFFKIETLPGSAHSEGEFLPDADSKCVICFKKEDPDGNDELIQCHGFMSGEMEGEERITELNKQDIEAYENAKKEPSSSTKTPPVMKPKLRTVPERPCRSNFHMSCIMKYNAGSFFFQYAARLECQAKFLCPLHCCNKCNLAHQKQSAYAPGLTECALCLRAFHLDTCYPAGARDHYVSLEVNEKGKNKTIKFELIICPAHFDEEEEWIAKNKNRRKSLPSSGLIKTGKIDRPIREHLRGCCNPACAFDRHENLINCRTCVRAFHRKCCEVQTIDGENVPEDQCESCICGDEIPLNVLVLSLYEGTKGFWLGKTVSWYNYPMAARKSSKFEKLGYTVVQWEYPESEKPSSPIMSIIPVSTIAPLIESYSELAPSKYKQFWIESFKHQEDRGFYSQPSVSKTVYASLKTSKYYKMKPKSTPSDIELCGCGKNVPNRCSEDSDCICVATGYECPSECAAGGEICNNRKISTAYVNPKIELRDTKFKGIGVFAKEDIAKGEFLTEYVGDIIDKVERQRRLDVVSKSRDFQANHYMMDLMNGKTVDATVRGNISRYMNHSCDPNSGVFQKSIPLNKQGTLSDTRNYVRTIKNIPKGVEITFCYKMDDLDNLPDCRCESINCTGTMGKSAAKVKEEKERKEAIKKRAMNNNKAKTSKKVNKQAVQPASMQNRVITSNRREIQQNITPQPERPSSSNRVVRQRYRRRSFSPSPPNRVDSRTTAASIASPNPATPTVKSTAAKRKSSVSTTVGAVIQDSGQCRTTTMASPSATSSTQTIQTTSRRSISPPVILAPPLERVSRATAPRQFPTEKMTLKASAFINPSLSERKSFKTVTSLMTRGTPAIQMAFKQTASPPAVQTSVGGNMFKALAPPVIRQTPTRAMVSKATASPATLPFPTGGSILKTTASPARQNPVERMTLQASDSPAGSSTPKKIVYKATTSSAANFTSANDRKVKTATPLSLTSTPLKRQSDTAARSTPAKRGAAQISPNHSSPESLDDSFSPGRMEKLIPNQDCERTYNSNKSRRPVVRHCSRNRRFKNEK